MDFIFRLENAKRALKGDLSGLRGMCIWDHTPQRHEYWRKEYNNLYYLKGLSDEARSIIEGWIKEAEGTGGVRDVPVDDHEGMIYNPISGTWSFGII